MNDVDSAKDQTGTTAGEALLAHFASAGYRRAEPAILQPAAVFLDQAGEDIRGRLYLTVDAAGAEMCLRPEYTVPVCREYLAGPLAGKAANYSYFGPVFRLRPGADGEFLQAGLESFGRKDREAADAEILSLALEAAESGGARALDVEIGDAGLFNAFLAALDLPAPWLRRLKRGLALGQPLETILTQPAGDDRQAGVLAALEGADKNGAKALVEDLLSIAGISSVGGRTAGEIAERFLEQASLRADGAPAEKRDLIARFLAQAGDPDGVSTRMRRLAKDAGLDLSAALDAFDKRLNFMAARGLEPADMHFSASFARRLDYYTGFVFEARAKTAQGAREQDKPVIGGGRYDGLLASLGARQDIPAVGAAIWIDRMTTGAAS
ncbi:MAG: ATP phosphoribosyltransferase regulatory subunit [Hyphomicrobiales bacterium]|nr:ATP phosphoribosyltransferase regulatory subunit [Hyphomicrobiales bacterium]